MRRIYCLSINKKHLVIIPLVDYHIIKKRAAVALGCSKRHVNHVDNAVVATLAITFNVAGSIAIKPRQAV